MRSAFSAIAFALTLFSVTAFAHGHTKPDSRLAFSSGVHAHLFWEQGPMASEESILRIELMNGATHTPTDVTATPEISLFMPSMNHGAPPTAIERINDDSGAPKTGVYRVSGIYFIMSGEWEVTLSLKNADGTSESQSFTLEIDGQSHGHH